jgi:hypothetical protein
MQMILYIGVRGACKTVAPTDLGPAQKAGSKGSRDLCAASPVGETFRRNQRLR